MLDSFSHLRQEVYDKICNTLIMEYKVESFGIDDLEHTDEAPPIG